MFFSNRIDPITVSYIMINIVQSRSYSNFIFHSILVYFTIISKNVSKDVMQRFRNKSRQNNTYTRNDIDHTFYSSQISVRYTGDVRNYQSICEWKVANTIDFFALSRQEIRHCRKQKKSTNRCLFSLIFLSTTSKQSARFSLFLFTRSPDFV